jgi:hypothetical protein
MTPAPTEPTDPLAPPAVAAASPSSRVSFDRLRERTDELELLVSGLITFVLLSLPPFLIDWYAGSFVHLSGLAAHLALIGAALAIGICFTLGGSFLLHLLVRAYWVGLIGLKSVFPQGIQWDKVPGTGPIGREYLRERLPDLHAAIDGADRFASGLFALISLATIVLLWATVAQAVIAALAALAGLVAGSFDEALLVVLGAVFFVFFGASLLLWVLDAVVAARSARWRADARLVRLVRGLRVFSGSLLPERLIIPVQWTLATNTRPRGFMAVLLLGTMLVPILGLGYVTNYRSFSTVGGYEHLPVEELDGGFASVHYESLRTPQDRLRPWPMIASDQVGTRFVRLFIPYHPRRDDPLLARLCRADGTMDDGAPASGGACLRRLWTVELDGRQVPLDVLQPAQRNDLGMRGLQGYLPLMDATPGMHLLVVRRQLPEGTDESENQRRTEFRIPFLFAPEPRG